MASTMVPPTQRRAFGEISSSRLDQLSARKNTQNALTDSIFNQAGKMDNCNPSKSLFTFASPAKRALPSSTVFDDDDFDSENVDPSLGSSKRSKGIDGTPCKKPAYHLDVQRADPASPTANRHAPPLFTDLPTTSAPRTAPAGRSPKHKRIGILSRKRTSLSPFKAINPPAFGIRQPSSSGLGFSIDAALNGTLTSRQPAQAIKAVPEDVKPKGWFFDIHEDTADEEAGILMEHSCLILDISSDDEEGPSAKDRLDRGKENVPPADYEAPPNAHGSTGASVPLKQRRSTAPDAMSEEDRAPLGALNAEEFYSEGLDATSVEVVADVESRVEEPTAETLPEQNTEDTNAITSTVNVDLLPGSEDPAPFIIAEDPPSPK